MEFQDPVDAPEAPHPHKNPSRTRLLHPDPLPKPLWLLEGTNLEWLEPIPEFSPREGTATSNTFPILPSQPLFAVSLHVPELSTWLFRAPARDPGLGQESSQSGKARDKKSAGKKGEQRVLEKEKRGIRWRQDQGMGWEALN